MLGKVDSQVQIPVLGPPPFWMSRFGSTAGKLAEPGSATEEVTTEGKTVWKFANPIVNEDREREAI
jgi:hypothetical protein